MPALFGGVSSIMGGAFSPAGRRAYMGMGRNVGAGFLAGIRGQMGRMPSQMYGRGYGAGLFTRTPGGAAAVGAGIGGVYGAMAGDTSVLGGALMGAGMGAGGAFAGVRMQGAARAGFRRNASLATNVGRSAGQLWGSMRAGATRFWESATLATNQGWNSFRAMRSSV